MSFTMSPRRLALQVGCGLIASSVLLGLGAWAHHSVGGQFDVSKKIVVSGTVEKVDWVNPHIYVHLKAVDAGGKAVTWSFGTVPVAMAKI